MEDRRIFIIVLSFNSRDFIVRCLKSIIQSRIKNLRIVVVDNGSTDESVGLIKAKFSTKVEIIENKENLGFARGNNRGIRFALRNGADYIFLLNPDITVEKETIKTLLRVMEDDTSLGIVGPKIYSRNGKIWSCGGEIDEKRFTAGLIGFGEKDCPQCSIGDDVDFVPGTAMFIRRKVFDTGLLPEKYFLYYEDVDFSLKVKKVKFRIYFTPDSIVYHDWSSSVGKKSPMKDYFMARNHLLFTERHAPFLIKLREFLRMPKTVCEHYQKGEKFALLGIRDYFLRRLGNRDYWS